MTDYVCKLTADGWQLYSFDAEEIENGKPDSASVARTLSMHLSHKVTEAKRALRSEPCLSEKKLARRIRDEMYTLMDKYSDAGASDTEPQCVLVNELERAFGLDSYSLER